MRADRSCVDDAGVRLAAARRRGRRGGHEPAVRLRDRPDHHRGEGRPPPRRPAQPGRADRPGPRRPARRQRAAAAAGTRRSERYVAAVAADLRAGPGKTLIRVGDGQPPAVHALAHAINARLGNLGQTVLFADPLPGAGAGSVADLRRLATALDGGTIHTLLVLGGNPVATAPGSVPLGDILTRQLGRSRADWLAVHLGQTFDETARVCHWHIPETHFLEQWGDGVAFDGTASIVQPLIAPLYGGEVGRTRSSPR